MNLSVDTSSRDIMELSRELGALYIDTVAEPWLGFYFDKEAGPEARTNYALARDHPRRAPPQSRRPDRGLLLRRQSRHGVMARQAGACSNLASDLGIDARGADNPARIGRP